MPTYEYVCTDCDNHWEEIQKISADALEVCPKCGHHTAKRQISAGNFILKGGGWYADLYSSTGNKSGSSGSSSAESTASAPAAAAPAAPAAAPAAPAPSGGSSGGGSSGGGSTGSST